MKKVLHFRSSAFLVYILSEMSATGSTSSLEGKHDEKKYGSGDPTGVAALRLRHELLELSKHPIEGW